MSFADRLTALKTTFAARLPGAVLRCVYQGVEFDGLANGRGIVTAAQSFADSASDAQKIRFLADDSPNAPVYGDKIIIADSDRIIRAATLDGLGVWWHVETGEYYNEFADIHNNQVNSDNATIYERIKTRVLDFEAGEFTQFEGGNFVKDQRDVLIRRDAWPLDDLPGVGFTLEYANRKSLYVIAVTESAGDIRLTCREA